MHDHKHEVELYMCTLYTVHCGRLCWFGYLVVVVVYGWFYIIRRQIFSTYRESTFSCSICLSILLSHIQQTTD